MSVDKRVIRAAIRERRRHLPATEVATAGAAVYRRLVDLPAYAAARSVAVYLANENEIPTDAVLDEASRTGRALYLPRCGAEADPVLVRWRVGDPLTAGPGGVWQPAATRRDVPEPPMIVLLPVVAWNASGTRLGRGGGFYDRLLRKLPGAVIRVGLAYEFQEVPGLPCECWDVPMHYVITERRLIPTTSSPGIEKGALQLE
jgi:5-formyltetrahydrofolate cyclo-ligase